ncbi:MAG: DUF4440 domain-containing protein [Planctomycetaceae bacterium]|nr:DUF4440 domain-containing protein [Planctomycetaceae bacterium]
MSELPASQAIELRLRAKVYKIGCIANIAVFLLLGGATLLVFPALARTLGLSTPASDEAQIRAVLAAQVAAWNTGDLDGFMAGYWRDENLTFISGDRLTQGWEGTRARYLKKYFTPNNDGKLTERGELSFAELHFESFSPQAVMVRGRYILKLPTEMATGRFTLALRKLPDGWRITSDHTSVDCPDCAEIVKKEKK